MKLGGINIEKIICEMCKGECCKNHSGIYSPDDFGLLTLSKVIELLENGNNIIDNDEKLDIKYIRPKNKNEIGLLKTNSISKAGECIHLYDYGCEINENLRPYQCKKLIPDINFPNQCRFNQSDGAEKNILLLKWNKYQKIIKEALSHFNL